MPDSTNEIWKPIPEWEGVYEVSDQGRVRSLARWIDHPTNGRTFRKGKVLSANPDGCGYLFLRLQSNGARKMRKVHQLVLEAFSGPRPDGHVGCHNNGNNQDNRAENLRWDTLSENSQDRLRHGRHNFAGRTHCKWGHEYTPENTNYHKTSGCRLCRTCQRDQNRRAYLKKLARRSGSA